MNIRPLLPSEWEMFRDMRLLALKSSPGMFETTYAQAAARTEADWRALLGPEQQQIFGQFEDDKLSGISGVFTSRDEEATAQLVMHFILPEYRGRRFAALFYQAGIGWARSRGLRRITVAARESNAPSLGAMRAAGFRQIGREQHTWPDGATEDELWYEMKL
jgi:RimJ/RimL family protein N-acetyltransferase